MKPIHLYGLLVYGSTNKNSLLPILKAQKKTLRLIYFKNKFYPSAELFKLSGISNIYDLYIIELCKFTLNSVRKCHCSAYLNALFSKNTNYIDTRSVTSGSYKEPSLTNVLRKNSLTSRGARLLNFWIKNNEPIEAVEGMSGLRF